MKEIPLTNSDKKALVDDSDYDILSNRPWKLDEYGYAVGYDPVKKRTRTMHTIITGTEYPEQETDHFDRNRLNNQRSNLRVATRSQNNSNKPKYKGKVGRVFSSPYKGVVLNRRNGTWIASCKVNKVQHRESYKSELAAAYAYNKMAIKYHAEFAYLNQFDGIPEEYLEKIIIEDRLTLVRNQIQSKYKGVMWCLYKNRPPDSGRWRAFVCNGGKKWSVGSFKTEDEAVAARQAFIANLGDAYIPAMKKSRVP